MYQTIMSHHALPDFGLRSPIRACAPNLRSFKIPGVTNSLWCLMIWARSFAFTICNMTLMFWYILQHCDEILWICFKNLFLEIHKLRFFRRNDKQKHALKRRQQAAFASACSLFFNRGTEGKGFSTDWPWNMLTSWKWIKNNVTGV